MNNEERYAESYKITQAIHIGTSEIVIGIDMNAKDNMYYMVADYENNGIFEKYDNALVSDSYTEILSIFTERINNGLAQIKEIEKNFSDKIVTFDMCDSISGRNLNGEIIVINADELYPEYRTQAYQIVRCTGGNGALANARGSAVFCEYFYKDKHARYERYDVLGTLKPEHYPEWLNKRLEVEKVKKKSHKEVER